MGLKFKACCFATLFQLFIEAESNILAVVESLLLLTLPDHSYREADAL